MGIWLRLMEYEDSLGHPKRQGQFGTTAIKSSSCVSPGSQVLANRKQGGGLAIRDVVLKSLVLRRGWFVPSRFPISLGEELIHLVWLSIIAHAGS